MATPMASDHLNADGVRRMAALARDGAALATARDLDEKLRALAADLEAKANELDRREGNGGVHPK